VAEQGYLAPLEHGAGSSCRSLYALALMFPPKLSSRSQAGRPPVSGRQRGRETGSLHTLKRLLKTRRRGRTRPQLLRPLQQLLEPAAGREVLPQRRQRPAALAQCERAQVLHVHGPQCVARRLSQLLERGAVHRRRRAAALLGERGFTTGGFGFKKKGNLKYKRGFNRVLESQQGFQLRSLQC
jgi:hypothetical protein